MAFGSFIPLRTPLEKVHKMIDPQDGAPTVTNDAVSNTPNTPPPTATTTTPDAQQQPSAASSIPATSTQPQTLAGPGGPLQLPPPSSPNVTPAQPGSGRVSNAPAAPVHPSVARAGVLYQVAQQLAGGPRYSTTIDPSTGATTRTAIPLSRGQIGMALALEAITGALSGLAQSGPAAEGKAGLAGLQQGQQIAQQRQQAQAKQDQQAQQDAENQYQALSRKAQLFEINSRTILNTKSAERADLENQQLGMQNMREGVAANSDLLSQAQELGAVTEDHVSQDALQAGIASGKYNAADSIALPDGIATIGGKPEQTFSIIPNTKLKANLTQQQYDAYANGNVTGFSKGTKIPPGGFPVSIFLLARANQQLQSINLMKGEFSSVENTLANSSDKGTQALAQSIPNINDLMADKTNGPVLANALSRFQKWTAYSDVHGLNLAESLRAMSMPTKPDPRNPKQMIPNPDAGAANTIAGAFGGGDPAKGWKVLQAFHDQVTPEPIKSVTEAQSIATDPTSNPREVARANAFLTLDRQQKSQTAGAEACARQGATGTGGGTLNANSLSPKEYGAIVDGIGTNTLDASQMLRYGKADQLKILADVKAKYPSFDATQYQANLGMQKWATSGKGGDQIQSLNTLHGHTADFLANMNALGNLDSSLLNTPINKLKSMTGDPNIVSLVGRMLAPRTEYMNLLNGNHALHDADKEDATKLLNENMSPSQMAAAMQQINTTADIRGSETNARYRATFGKDMPNYHPTAAELQARQSQPRTVPAGATPGRDSNGNIIGYRLNGQVVRF